MSRQKVRQAAEAIAAADAILFTAGAGMGVDSGLPDFRGDGGFWRAYPPLKRLGIDFMSAANPRLFENDPHLAWGFYGHRYNLYTETEPHAGYCIQKRIAEMKPHYVYTSNVDGAHVKAGFDPKKIVECHGSIFHWQSTRPDESPGIWEAVGQRIKVDIRSFRAEDPLPRCPRGYLARPNIMMFGDWAWEDRRMMRQSKRWRIWVGPRKYDKCVVLECGAGSAIPSLRGFGENWARMGATLIRVNPTEPEDATIPLKMGAACAMQEIEAALDNLGFFSAS